MKCIKNPIEEKRIDTSENIKANNAFCVACIVAVAVARELVGELNERSK